MPDYAVLVDDDENVVCRYFIIDMVYQCKGQYVATIYRDLVADYYIELLNAPIFVEKGPLADSDPFVFNEENMTFNQIKLEEEPIRDATFCPWIIGYISNSNSQDGEGNVRPYSFQFEKKASRDYTVSTLSDYATLTGVSAGEYFQPVDYSYKVYGKLSESQKFIMAFNDRELKPTGWNMPKGWAKEDGPIRNGLYVIAATDSTPNDWLNAYMRNIGTLQQNLDLLTAYGNYATADKVNTINAEKNKIVYVENEQAYYRVKVEIINGSASGTIAVDTAPFQMLSWAT